MKRFLIISVPLLLVVFSATADRRRLLMARQTAATASGIAFRSFTTNVYSGTTTTLNTPSGAAAGDLLVAFHVSDTVHTVNVLPTGFTEITNNTLGASGFSVSYKVADGTEGATLQWGFTSSEVGVTLLAAYSGVNASPFDQHAAESGAPGAGVAHTTPQLTPANNNSLLIGVIFIDPAGVPVFTEVSGYPLRATATSSGSGAIALADKVQTTAALEGVQITEDTGGTWGEYILVIKP